MAGVVNEPELSLMSLEDELTCSICLSPFTYPVTLPCGHNFCRDCLLASWEDIYSCPQCRCFFPTKPELKKNTVLSTVVETFTLRSGKNELVEEVKELVESAEEKTVEEETIIRCDTCMMVEASHTCLTCMASYCEQHLRPHLENPVFRLHQLSQPVSDLSQRICSEHHKLMELFCTQHVRPICSFCLQQVHKGCIFTTPEEQRIHKVSDLRNKVDLLDTKILKNQSVISQMSNMQDKLKDDAAKKKKVVAAEYQQLRDMLTQDENAALTAVDREVESGQTKLRVLSKKFSENIDHMRRARDDINSLLSQSQTMSFLQTSFTLPSAINFDPYTPRINLDSKKVLAIQAFSPALKDYLTVMFQQPVESRMQLLQSGQRAASTPVTFGSSNQYEPYYTPPSSHGQDRGQDRGPYLGPDRGQDRGPDRGPDPKAGKGKKSQKQTKPPQLPEHLLNIASSMEYLLDFSEKNKTKGHPAAPQPKQKPDTLNNSPNTTSAEKRTELLKYGRALTFDRKTAHKRITLTEEFTKASVSDEQANYPDCPQRFAVCSQVLASRGFSKGYHYWEVRLSCNNFIGIGLAYNRIERKGPDSRLGRNAHSWCVEWFNVKLSAWHNSLETVLDNPSPKRVGVLLDCDGGRATFYNVADRAYPFHSFAIPIHEAVYPAFWMFSSGSSVTLCKMQA